jgi:hypothetical protein
MMVTRPVFILALASAALGGIWIVSHGQSRAQVGTPAPADKPPHVADAMLLPVRLPFGEGKTLDEVVTYLRNELKANVVLDIAALDRHDVKPSSKVRLDLQGVRLKTGLKLLLDQVGLTVRVLPEDNLLLITDKQESQDPIDRVLDEIKALHRDVHSLQDSVRDLKNLMELPIEEDPAPRMRNPTIIEEVPAEGADAKNKDKDNPEGGKRTKDKGRTRPGV